MKHVVFIAFWTVALATSFNSKKVTSTKPPPIIGLIGGIASGKSTVCDLMLSNFGAIIINADQVGHEMYRPGSQCFRELIDAFGDVIVNSDGFIDRKILGSIVFSSNKAMDSHAKRNELNDIIWPRMREAIQAKISDLVESGATATAHCVVLEAALLIEAGWDDMCDQIWLVTTNDDIAVERLMRRNLDLSKEEANARLEAQRQNTAKRRALCDVEIENRGCIEELERTVRAAALRSLKLVPQTHEQRRTSALANREPGIADIESGQ